MPPGLVRHAVKADLPRRHFWTFTVWKTREAVNSFVSSEPHETAVKKFHQWAGESAAFVEWASADGSINWTEALERLKNPTYYFNTPKAYAGEAVSTLMKDAQSG